MDSSKMDLLIFLVNIISTILSSKCSSERMAHNGKWSRSFFFTCSSKNFLKCTGLQYERSDGYADDPRKTKKKRQKHPQLTMSPMEPETSMQNITIEFSSPWQLAASVTGAGLIMYVTSGWLGISSARMSTEFLVPQNSHCHVWTTTSTTTYSAHKKTQETKQTFLKWKKRMNHW